MIRRVRRIGPLLAATALAAASAGMAAGATEGGDALLAGFRDPPASARPRVWWHWMNGNISREGIARDLAWMKRVGIGGAQTFDAALDTPQIVDRRLVYMTPAWKDAFRFAAAEADRLGLELAIASSPGWSETGGPWVPPADGLKKIVWSETIVDGGRPFAGRLATPPDAIGPFQSIGVANNGGSLLGSEEKPPLPAPVYGEIAVLAVPLPPAPRVPEPAARASDGTGASLDATLLSDDDLASAVTLAPAGSGPPSLMLRYARPRTVRSVRLFLPGGASFFGGGSYRLRVEASEDGTRWRTLAETPATLVPTTLGFAPVTARAIRLVVERARNTAAGFAPQTPGVDFGRIGKGMGAMLAAPKLRVGEFRPMEEDRIDQAETKAGFALSPDYYALSADVPETTGVRPDAVIDLTGRMRADGSLDWTPPRGRWRVLRLGWSLTGKMNHPAPREATGLEVDKYDGAAVRRYLTHYLGLYRDAAGPDLIGARGVRALLTDSIEVGPANWTPRMIARFRQLRGYDPQPWLPALAGIVVGDRRQSDRFLYDYRRTLSDLMASEHYGTVAAVAHENGLKVYGEALEDKRPAFGDDMAMRSHTDVPMGALWTFPRARGPSPSQIADLRGAASVAHIYGRNLVAAESMTSLLSPWASGPADLKRVIDLAFAMGVNRPVIHTSVHVPVEDRKPGLALSIFGQYFNRNESWAELARPWIDYLARNAFLLQQGRNHADVAYFYGEEAPLTGLYGDAPVADAPTDVAWDFVNADALLGALANDGADLVTPGGARYRLLYLGGASRRLSVPVLRRLKSLVEGGATVLGRRPEASPSLGDDAAAWRALADALWPAGGEARLGRGRMIAGSDVDATLRRIGVAPDVRLEGAGDAQILWTHRRLADGDGYFLSNRRDRSETVEARFRVTGKAPDLWHAETGTVEPAPYRIVDGETVVPLTLTADESVHVLFRRRSTALAFTPAPTVQTPVATLDGPWRVTFQPGRGAPADTTLAPLAPLEASAVPGIRYFSGIATYTHGFATPRGWRRGQPLWLDLGEAREVAEVTVNGRAAGAVWHAPYRLDIGGVVRPGRNVLSVRVANLWVNRLIGDAQPGAEKIAFATGPTYVAKAPLRRSGLIGPVRLLVRR